MATFSVIMTKCYPTDTHNLFLLTFCYHLSKVATLTKEAFAYVKYLAGFPSTIFLA